MEPIVFSWPSDGGLGFWNGAGYMGLMAQVYVGLDALLLWFPLFLKLMGHEARAFKFYIQNFNYFLP